MRILFVENHAIFARTVIRQFLSTHEVVVVPSLAEAQALLAGSSFDLALVDYDLDDGKGDQLIDRLTTVRPPIPAIAVSSHDQGNRALVAAGAMAICAKSDFPGIQSVIDELFLRLPPRSPSDPPMH